MKNKLVSLLVVSLGKIPNGVPPSLCGRQMATSLERRWAPLTFHKPAARI